MKVSRLEVTSWSTGTVTITLDNNDLISVNLTEDESAQVRQLGSDIFFARQQSIADEIRKTQPELLGDFSEVND